MKTEHWLAGWTRIDEQEFKRVAAEALRQNPQMHHDIRQAITISSARVGVPHETRDRYLTWLDEVEKATTTMAEAERVKRTRDFAMPSAR